MLTKDNNYKLLSRDGYYNYLRELESLPAGYCAFCDTKANLILKEFKYWNLIVCKAPYWIYHLILLPKRHFKEVTDTNANERLELFNALEYITKKLYSANLLYDDGTPITRYIFFWRFREDSYDPIRDVQKSDHYHLHITPEKEHMWTPILDSNAYKMKVEVLIDLFK